MSTTRISGRGTATSLLVCALAAASIVATSVAPARQQTTRAVPPLTALSPVRDGDPSRGAAAGHRDAGADAELRPNTNAGGTHDVSDTP